MSIATLFLWCGTLLVTLTFLSLVRALTAPGAFLLYAVICIAAFLFVRLAVPETKGRPFEVGFEGDAKLYRKEHPYGH